MVAWYEHSAWVSYENRICEQIRKRERLWDPRRMDRNLWLHGNEGLYEQVFWLKALCDSHFRATNYNQILKFLKNIVAHLFPNFELKML